MYMKRIAVSGILAALIFGAVYGFATAINISRVNSVGGVSADVPPPPDINGVVFLIDSDDYTMVDKVVIYLVSSMTGYAYVQITDSAGNIIAKGSNWLDSDEVTVDFTPNVAASRVYDIDITLLEEQS